MYLHKYFAFQLKDWPPDKDFSSYLPDHFADLMKWIPLKPYILREGHFNLGISHAFVLCEGPNSGPRCTSSTAMLPIHSDRCSSSGK